MMRDLDLDCVSVTEFRFTECDSNNGKQGSDNNLIKFSYYEFYSSRYKIFSRIFSSSGA
jgi:hypothetical protein